MTDGLYLLLLAAISLERKIETALARRNARRARERGGVELGQGHYRVMVALHVAFLAACVAEAFVLAPEPPAALWVPAVLALLAAQGLRWWAVATLGDRWNTRIVVLPGAPPVTAGPYRFLRHPNYVAVVLEFAALPLAGGAWRTAVVFSALNAALLAVRIPAEERALGAAYADAFQGVPRFLPAQRGRR